MPIYADFDALWASLPQCSDAKAINPPDPAVNKRFSQIPGMDIPIGWETCCIQMSSALNSNGLPIDYFNKSRVIHDGAGNEYMLDVSEMRGYLGQTYVEPDVYPRSDGAGGILSRGDTQDMMGGRRGILAFGNRHIDLWDGTKIHGQNYNVAALWEAPSAIQYGVALWEIA